MEEREFEVEQLPEAAGADEAEDGGHADVHLPAVERVGDELRQRRRQGAVEKGQRRARAGQAQGGVRRGRGVLQRFGIKPAEDAGGVQGQRQHAGEGAEADGEGGQRGPDEFGHRAQDVERQRPRRAPARQGQRQAGHRGDERADGRDGQRFPGTAGDARQPGGREVGREETGDEGGDRNRRVDGEQLGEAQFKPQEAARDGRAEGDGEGCSARSEGRRAGRRGRIEAAAQGARKRVGGEHQDDEGGEDARRFAAIEHLHRLVHQLAEAAGADEAHHHRGTDRAFPAIDGVGDEFAGRLRQEAVEQRQRARRAVLAQGVGWAAVDRFEDFGIDLAQHAAVGQAEGEYAGSRPEAEDAHEDERPDELGHAAQHGEDEAGAGAQLGAFARRVADPVGEWQCQEHGERQPGGGDGQRFERGAREQGEEKSVARGRQEAGEKAADDLQVAGVEERARAHPGGLGERPEDGDRCEQAGEAREERGVARGGGRHDGGVCVAAKAVC